MFNVKDGFKGREKAVVFQKIWKFLHLKITTILLFSYEYFKVINIRW